MVVLLIYFLYLCKIIEGFNNDVFHENSKTIFRPNGFKSEFFGYSVSLSSYGFVVGAPKAKSLTDSYASGSAYKCPLEYENYGNVSCSRIQVNGLGYNDQTSTSFEEAKGMMFGANVAPISPTTLLICAPLRHSRVYDDNDYRSMQGKCYIHGFTKTIVLEPLIEYTNQYFRTKTIRRENVDLGVVLKYYAFGHMGFSMTVNEKNEMIVGAPGMMEWTGGVVIYKNNFGNSYTKNENIVNTYYTPELKVFNYFGYSVESGVFEKNGRTLFVGGAPRGYKGSGLVLVFKNPRNEIDPLKVLAKLVGPHLGSYFGASLCCTDIDGDGRSDLLVGAPTYIKKNNGHYFDQGAVFIYMAREKNTGFYLEEAGFVTGSGENGARFGLAIAALGDIDGDGYKDIAIGAPWENNGAGSVYIYKGNKKGLRNDYVQKITTEGVKSFGISISKGYDFDKNHCNDLAIGAHASDKVYLYKCIPTVDVYSYLTIPDAMNIPENATEFTVETCVDIPDKPLWSHVKLHLKSRLLVNSELNRARVVKDADITIEASPRQRHCFNRTIAINLDADMSRPISIKHEIIPLDHETSSIFPRSASRISDKSKLHSSMLLQLLKDCGNDFICSPWLNITMVPLTNPYIPGTDAKLGFNLTVLNTEEPATGIQINITLPSTPKRVPVECSIEELNMICDIPSPLARNKEIVWEIELDYANEADELSVKADLVDMINREIADEISKTIKIDVKHIANFTIDGNVIGNETVFVSRDKLNDGETISFTHFYKITNHGPSNCRHFDADIIIPDKIGLSDTLKGCEGNNTELECGWSLPAKASMAVRLDLKLNLSEHGDFLKSVSTFNTTSVVILNLNNHNSSFEITTTFNVEPSPPIWPIIVGALFGFLILAGIIFGLYKANFFSRNKKDELEQLKEAAGNEPTGSQEEQGDTDASPTSGDNLTTNDQ